jgi:hypothetical protein
LPADKRKIKGEKDRFYLYTLASSINKTDFVAYMTDRANGIIRPRPEPVFNLAIPEDKNQLPLGDDSIPDNSDYTVPGTEPELTPEQLEIIEQEKERQQLEMMKMSNQNILSGPPPDRVKPKEEPKEAPVEEQQQPEPVQEQQPPVEQQPLQPQPVTEEQKPEKKDAKKKKASAPKQEEPVQEQPQNLPTEGKQNAIEPAQNEAVPAGNNNSVIIEDIPAETPKKGKQKKGKKQDANPEEQPE